MMTATLLSLDFRALLLLYTVCAVCRFCYKYVFAKSEKSDLWFIIIGITHVSSCINTCWVPRKLFEHEANRLSSQTCAEGGGKC